MSGLRDALEKKLSELQKRSGQGEAHLFLNVPIWDLEELLAAHPAEPVDVVVVHSGDLEKQAEHFNEGYATAVEQFAGLLVEIRSDLATMALAKDVLGWLDDAVKAMDGGR
jgi:hypothetical protein